MAGPVEGPLVTAPAVSPAQRDVADRDPALDLLRAVALVRVVVWHTFAATWMTLFAAIPVMFFVAGTLLDSSRSRRGHTKLVLRRARRLLIPLWAYGVVVALAGAVRAVRSHQPLTVSASALRHAATWVLPLVDPSSSGWHGGWLSGHLWYLRAYLWVVLLAPLLALLARRLVVSLPLLAAGVAGMELAARAHVPVLGSGSVHVLVGDFITYGLFVVLGMAYHRHRRAIPRRAFAALAVVAAYAAGYYVTVVGIPHGDVNESYPAIALVGVGWLLLAGAAEQPVRWLASRRPVAAATRLISGRAETVYLWHPAAIVVAYAVVDHWAPVAASTLVKDLHPLSTVTLLAIIAVLVLVATLAVGWIEDFAAGRRPAHRRRQLHLPAFRVAALFPPAAVSIAVAMPLLVLPATGEGTTAISGQASHPVRPPSYREALGDAAFSSTSASTAPARSSSATLSPARLQAALDAWTAQHDDLGAVAVAVARSGKVWTGNASHDPTDVIAAADEYAVASITKSFTIGLVLQQAAAGRIDLDAPMPSLPGVAAPPAGTTITPRMLLQHTSGLVDYSLASGFDQRRMLTPASAVSLSVRTKLQSAPGTEVHYANSNYLWLGLLLEHVTGRSYHDLVATIATSTGLKHTFVDPAAVPGWVGFSSGGIRSTVGDVAMWEQALFTPNRIVPANFTAQLTTLDSHNVGLGTWPLCPCGTDAKGTKTYTAIGHYIGNGGTYHYPDGMTLVVRVDPPKANSEALIVSLGQALRAALA